MSELKDFDKKWIDVNIENKDNHTILKLNEKYDVRSEIKDDLIETIIEYYIPKERINHLKNEKFSDLENLINSSIPDKDHDKIRKGDFGEIISSEHLKQRHNYYFPYPKLTYNPNHNTSSKGDDILAFKINENNIISLCLGEVKVISKYSNTTLNNAYSQLESSYKPHPKSLNLIMNYMYNINDSLVFELEKLLVPEKFKSLRKDNWIFIISGNNPNKLEINKEINLDNLKIVSFPISDLNNFINELYDSCGEFYND